MTDNTHVSNKHKYRSAVPYTTPLRLTGDQNILSTKLLLNNKRRTLLHSEGQSASSLEHPSLLACNICK